MVEFCTYIEILDFPISIDIIIPYTGVDLRVFSWIGKARPPCLLHFLTKTGKELEKTNISTANTLLSAWS